MAMAIELLVLYSSYLEALIIIIISSSSRSSSSI